jgi:hypothetical protein
MMPINPLIKSWLVLVTSSLVLVSCELSSSYTQDELAAWEEFKSEHSKPHDQEVDQRRPKIFADNRQQFNADQKGAPTSLKMTGLSRSSRSDLAIEKMDKLRNGGVRMEDVPANINSKYLHETIAKDAEERPQAR